MKTPAFWYRPFGFISALLSPLSLLYGLSVLIQRALTKPQSVNVPVICVGNVTIGGAGKTPCVIAIAKFLKQKGYQVHILSRGYRGQLTGPLCVDPEEHTALDVGDEPLILSRFAPTWIAKNRYSGARAAQAAGAEIILMDDGLQNNELRKDFSIVVIDQRLDFGNGALLPSGPLREPLRGAINKANAILLTSGHTPSEDIKKIRGLKPIYQVRTQVVPDTLVSLAHKRIFAFSGIAHPQKFYDTLRQLEMDLVGTRDFPDHHHFTQRELKSLLGQSTATSAILVTTEKDWVRLDAYWRDQITYVRIENIIERESHLLAQLVPLLQRKAV
jgi:tetraacyldisaccharide 4'-kinase